MFTRSIPRTGEPVTRFARTGLTRVGAIIGTIALGAGLSLVPISANAEETTSSYSQAQFLSGTIAGTDLSNLLALEGAEARNNGAQDTQRAKDPLEASVIRAITLQAAHGIQAELGDFLDVGAIGQYAEAQRNGVSMASSGAVGSDGAIGVGAVGSGSAGDLTLDLNRLLGSQFSSVLTELKLSLDAVAASAHGDKTTASGDYSLAGAVLTFSSPAIGDLSGKVTAALGTVDQSLQSLSGADGALGKAVDGVLDPVLSVVGSSADVSASVTADLNAAVQSLLSGSYGTGAVRFNLQTGSVSVDLAQLLGGQLNDLPVGTELLTDEVVTQVLKGITDTVSTLSDQIVSSVTAALHAAQVSVHADLNLLSSGGTGSQQVCRDVQIPIIGDIVSGGVGLVGGLLGGNSVTQGIVGHTTKTLCDVVSTVLPDLRSTVTVDVQGSVDQLLNGGAAKADASISLLGGTVSAAVDVTAIIGGIGQGLLSGLFSSDGAVSTLTAALNSGLVTPAVSGLLGDTSVHTVLTKILSVTVNLQDTRIASQRGTAVAHASMFTQTAVRVAVLQGTLATINLAAATVGPNVTTVVDPGCTSDCDPGGPNPCTVNCGPGGPTTTTTASDRLAFTGVGIAALIAVILALLAAGAYLAREGYRRALTQAPSLRNGR